MQDVFFHLAVKAADNATTGLALGDSPIIAFQHGTGRYPAAAQKSDFGQIQ
jgi:hypothetical protein